MQRSSTTQTRAQATNPFRERLAHEVDVAMVRTWVEREGIHGVLVDARKPDDYKEGHVPGAINVQADEIVAFARGHEADRFIVYCYHTDCLLATKAAAELVDAGFDVREMIGGWETWENHVLNIKPHMVERGEGRKGMPSAEAGGAR